MQPVDFFFDAVDVADLVVDPPAVDGARDGASKAIIAPTNGPIDVVCSPSCSATRLSRVAIQSHLEPKEDLLSDLAELYTRNADFAESFDLGHLPIKPNLATLILTCVDARLDPAHFAGIQLGDALVLRNVGARVTEAVALEVSMLWQLMAMAVGGTPSIELVIIEHTACGMARFADPEVAARVTDHFGTNTVVDTYAIVDPLESLATDIGRLRANPIVPDELSVSGHLYDVTTGRLSMVVETAPLR